MKSVKLLALFCLMLFATVSIAQVGTRFETQSIGGRFYVYHEDIESIRLPGPRFIRSIVVNAEGLYDDSIVEVMVNGVVKGTIFAPGRDPSYVVTIGEATSSIEFRHRSGGRMYISNVVATMSSWTDQHPNPGPNFPYDPDQVTSLAQRTLESVEMIRPYATLNDEQTYLLPLKKKAGQVIVMSRARGNQANKTIKALSELQEQISFSEKYLNSLMETEGLFTPVVELLTIEQTIDDLLN